LTRLSAVKRLPRIDIAGEPQRRLSNGLRHFASLPIELTPARMLPNRYPTAALCICNSDRVASTNSLMCDLMSVAIKRAIRTAE